MSISNLFLLLLITFLILLSGFLSGSETAITAASKARVISKIKKGSKKANYLKIIIDKIKIKLLVPFAIFLLLVFANHESKTKTTIKIIIPKKTKFIY